MLVVLVGLAGWVLRDCDGEWVYWGDRWMGAHGWIVLYCGSIVSEGRRRHGVSIELDRA